jgi:hypothetical protein
MPSMYQNCPMCSAERHARELRSVTAALRALDGPANVPVVARHPGGLVIRPRPRPPAIKSRDGDAFYRGALVAHLAYLQNLRGLFGAASEATRAADEADTEAAIVRFDALHTT